MVKGAPDHFKGVALYAWDGSKLVLIKVDSSGQLYALLMGDAAGTPTPISVTADGELYAALKAVFNGSMIDVLADSAGNLTLNLAAQDLAEVISRSKYGSANSWYTSQTCTAGQVQGLGSVSGKGVVYGGFVYVNEAWNVNDQVYIYCDQKPVDILKVGQAWNDDLTCYRPHQLYINNYDLITPRLHIGIGGGWTFETKFEVAFIASTTDRQVQAEPIYAIV